MNIGKETETIEFKESTGELKEACQSVAAILNKCGYGTVYFGVTDHGEVIGQKVGKGTKREIVNAITQAVEPLPYFEVNTLTTPEGTSFIEVPFRGNNSPYTCHSVFYIRMSDADKKMDREMVKDFFAQSIEDYSAWENTPTAFGTDDIDEKRLLSFYEKGKVRGKIKIDYASKESLLKKLQLVSGDKLNNAGYYLFSDKEPVKVKLVCFTTESRLTISDMLQYSGNIFDCIDKTMQFAAEHIEWRVKFTGKAERQNVPEIPMEAMREIIVNAFAHGKYDSNTSFAVEIFSDRVSVYSPGRFPRGATPEQFAYESREPIFMNPKIVDVLYKGDEIETLASGFERAFTFCKKAGVKYEYFFTDSGFRFVFYRPSHGHDLDKLTAREENILSFLADNSTATFKELSEEFGVSLKTIQRAMTRLKELGYIIRHGSDTSGSWEVVLNPDKTDFSKEVF